MESGMYLVHLRTRLGKSTVNEYLENTKIKNLQEGREIKQK